MPCCRKSPAKLARKAKMQAVSNLFQTFELQVLVNGNPVKEYGQQGKTYVEGRKSQPFTLKFRNHSAAKVLAVPSIDGISTLDGKPATAQSRGYVVAGYASLEIKGWKTSTEDSAEFVFTDKSRGYAAQTAGDANSGVIGLIVFEEKQKPAQYVIFNSPAPEHHHYYHHPVFPAYPHIWYGGTSTPLSEPVFTYSSATSSVESEQVRCAINNASMEIPKTSNAAPEFNLATGWGKQITDKVMETDFERGNQLVLLEVYYSDETGLSSAGIQLTKGAVVSKAFPQSFGGFCSPPKIVV
jgi:hypothetical protein